VFETPVSAGGSGDARLGIVSAAADDKAGSAYSPQLWISLHTWTIRRRRQLADKLPTVCCKLPRRAYKRLVLQGSPQQLEHYMKTPADFSARNSNFVALALVSSLSRLLSSHITMQIGHEWRNDEGKETWAALLPSFCMSSFLTSAVAVATRTPVEDVADLDFVLDELRVHLQVVEPCPAEAKQRGLEFLKHCLRLAEADAKAALHEASSDFPVSGGSFCVWESERQAAVVRSCTTTITSHGR
jgi:hypothetical protein